MRALREGEGVCLKANIASPFRRKGCAKDPAARLCGRGGFGQGEPAKRGSPAKGLNLQPGFAGAEALARGNPQSEVPPPKA